VNRRFLVANAFLLMYVTFLPFPTRVLAEHLHGAESGAAVTFYCGTFVVGSAAMILLVESAVHGQLFSPEVDMQFIRRYRRAARVGLFVNIAATLMSLILPALALALTFAVRVAWLRFQEVVLASVPGQETGLKG
jgi:uncharacterized membrane protein